MLRSNENKIFYFPFLVQHSSFVLLFASCHMSNHCPQLRFDRQFCRNSNIPVSQSKWCVKVELIIFSFHPIAFGTYMIDIFLALLSTIT